MNPKRPRSRGDDSTGPTRTRLLLTGVLVCLVLLAGCGGNTDDGGTTVATTQASVEETATGAPTMATATGASSTTPSTCRSSRPSTMLANGSTNASGLEVTVEPTTENTTDVNLTARATMTDATASEGIETITIETGGGLDLTNVSVANVDTAGIDENGSLARDRTDESLASSVERDVRVADDGRRLTIPLDGNVTVEPGDEIVAVLEGGVETRSAGNYTFGLTVDNATAQTDDYTITSS